MVNEFLLLFKYFIENVVPKTNFISDETNTSGIWNFFFFFQLIINTSTKKLALDIGIILFTYFRAVFSSKMNYIILDLVTCNL